MKRNEECIHYYSLSANQNYSKAQYNLGIIYYNGELVPQNIDKAIHYLSLSANQNNSDEQNNLGLIYYEGEFVQNNVNKK